MVSYLIGGKATALAKHLTRPRLEVDCYSAGTRHLRQYVYAQDPVEWARLVGIQNHLISLGTLRDSIF